MRDRTRLLLKKALKPIKAEDETYGAEAVIAAFALIFSPPLAFIGWALLGL